MKLYRGWVIGVSLCMLGVAISWAEEKPAPNAGKPLRTLFIGNSYTGYNDLYRIVEAVSKAAGVERPLETFMVAPGGYTFSDHWNMSDATRQKGVTENATLKTLREGTWDIVVLQAYTDAITNPDDFMKYGRLLAEEVKKKNARLVFYETWPFNGKEPGKPQPEILQKLNKVYFDLARETGGTVSPVGMAFEIAKTKKPDFNKTIHYGGNDEHPSPVGSYLIACVHFATIYDRSPVGLPEDLTESPTSMHGVRNVKYVDKDMAAFLQGVAWEAVQEAKKLSGQDAKTEPKK
jgi:hypothetical protein